MTTTTIKERPLLMSGPLVRATLADLKTQTRRVARFVPREPGLNLQFTGLEAGLYCTDAPEHGWVLRSRRGSGTWEDQTKPLHCPYGQVGDRLWVRETFALDGDDPFMIMYAADGKGYGIVGDGSGGWMLIYHCHVLGLADQSELGRWVGRKRYGPLKPSIFMRRFQSRLLLEITSVRVERLQHITDVDAEAEGMTFRGDRGWCMYGTPEAIAPMCGSSPRGAFFLAWQKINGHRNPWGANPWVWVIGYKRVNGVTE